MKAIKTIINVATIFFLGVILGRLINAKVLINQKNEIVTLKRQLTNEYTNRYYRNNLLRFDTFDSDSTNAQTKN